jgi:hypothetical protein
MLPTSQRNCCPHQTETGAHFEWNRVPTSTGIRRQVAKSEARGWDSRKVYRDISIDGLSKLADGRVVYLDINFDSGPGGYRIRVEHPDKTVLYGAFCSSIAKLKDSGTLKALLDQSTVTPELPILVLA